MRKNRIIYIVAILVLVMLASTGCKNKELKGLAKSDTVVLTVDDSSVYLDELMYHVMLTEMQGELYASFLEESDFWNKEYSDGVTMGEVMKQETMDNAIKYELLYQRAIDEKYTLSEEERTQCSSKVESIVKSIQEDTIKEMGLTDEKLLAIQKKITLCTRYYDENYKSKGIDDETAYEQLKEEHKIKVNQKVWKQVELREIKN